MASPSQDEPAAEPAALPVSRLGSAIAGVRVAGVGRYLLVGTAYVLAGKLGLLLPIGQGNVTLVWAPSGIALAAVLLLGYRIWPALVAAAFIVNLTTSAPPLVAVATAIGN